MRVVVAAVDVGVVYHAALLCCFVVFRMSILVVG